jgi:hypothetical protein
MAWLAVEVWLSDTSGPGSTRAIRAIAAEGASAPVPAWLNKCLAAHPKQLRGIHNLISHIMAGENSRALAPTLTHSLLACGGHAQARSEGKTRPSGRAPFHPFQNRYRDFSSRARRVAGARYGRTGSGALRAGVLPLPASRQGSNRAKW